MFGFEPVPAHQSIFYSFQIQAHRIQFRLDNRSRRLGIVARGGGRLGPEGLQAMRVIGLLLCVGRGGPKDGALVAVTFEDSGPRGSNGGNMLRGTSSPAVSLR